MSQNITPQTFSAAAGEAVRIPIAVTQADGTPTDLTNVTMRFRMARTPSGAAVVDSDPALGNAAATVTDASAGQCRATIAGAVTAGLLGTYYWEMLGTDTSSNPVRVAYGWFTFRPAQ